MFSRLEVLSFWEKAQMLAGRKSVLESTATKVLSFRDMYEDIESHTGVPWWVIGAIDSREENFDHKGYLGNGDPLSRKTVHVPRGRGPFKNWAEGAIDALHISGWDRLPPGGHWDIVTCLIKCEVYNGSGYGHMGLRSPYVWGGTNMQQRGKYTSDGHFDGSAWDIQPGCAGIFLALKSKYGIDLNEA